MIYKKSAFHFVVNVKRCKQINIAIKRECSYKQMIKNNKKWEKDYFKQNYEFLTSENIFKKIIKELSN